MLKDIYIDAFPLYGKCVLVKTTNQEVIDVINVAQKYTSTVLEQIYRDTYKSLIDININKMTDSEWDMFICEIIISYCLRYVLYKKPIPIKVSEQ